MILVKVTYIPQAAPPKCAAWSKNFQPNKTPAVSSPTMNFIACNEILLVIISLSVAKIEKTFVNKRNIWSRILKKKHFRDLKHSKMAFVKHHEFIPESVKE